MKINDDVLQELQHCEEKVKHLEEENACLREASDTFRGLAERLNTTLQQDRPESGSERPLPTRLRIARQREVTRSGHEEIGDL